MSKNSAIARANAMLDWLKELKSKFGYSTKQDKIDARMKERRIKA